MNNLKKLSFYFGVFVILFPAIGYASCPAPLSRTLSLGMKGADVKVFQQFLNDFPENQIAKAGVNSKGKESGTFDTATLKAFKSFQTKNADIILKPAGVKSATGIVGKYSRTVINKALCVDSEVSSGYDAEMTEAEVITKFNKDLAVMKAKLSALSSRVSATKDPNLNLTSAKKELESIKSRMDDASAKNASLEGLSKQISAEIGKDTSVGSTIKIKSILPASPKIGDTIYIFAVNLESVNKLFFGDKTFSVTLASPTDNFVKFIIPASIPSGLHSVYLENKNGKSEKVSIQINNVSVSTVGDTAPHITSISPTSGNVGTTVTINGDKFTKSNTIHTTSKSYFGIESTDGKTLKFVVEADKSLLGNGTKLISQLPFTFFVRNENGDSNVAQLKLE